MNINTNDAVKKNDNISKCKYSNRGYCKFGQKCSFLHFKTNCEEFVTKGFCGSPKSCLFRHPKHCRYWTKKIVGCHRGETCQYLHDPTKKFIEAKENKVTTNRIISDSSDEAKDNKPLIKESNTLSISEENVFKNYSEFSSYKNNDLSKESSTNGPNCDLPSSTKVNLQKKVNSDEIKTNPNIQVQNSEDDSVDKIKALDKNLSQKISSNNTEYNYPCNQCDFKAISKVHLNSHATFSHSTVIKDIYKTNETKVKNNTGFSCDKCAYIAGSSTGLEAHKAFTH